MNTSSDTSPLTSFQVGDWRVDPDSGRLHRGGAEVKLEPKVMQVLVCLAQHPAKVVSREELESKVWTGTVVGYDAIAGSIIKLRKALGDNSRSPTYIETVSKKGYRLIAPVTEVTGEAQAAKTSRPAAPTPLTGRQGTRRSLIAAVFGLAAVIGLLAFLAGEPANKPRATPVAEKIPSVVVLPFKNISDDPGQDYFIEGITDDLITDLARLDSVRVIARQSAYHYADNPASVEDIARQLDVLYIVEGSVQKVDKRIRVNVRLIDTTKGQRIWAKRFDTDTTDIFKTQDDISMNVMNAMYVTLSGSNNGLLGTRGTTSFEAYDAFLLGQQYIKARSRQGYEQTMNAYRRAIRIDPNYARAYGAMAVTMMRGYRYRWSDLSQDEARDRALELAKKAVALNQSTPEIYWSLGYVHLHRREFDAAETAAKQSVALSPNYADGYALLANIANWRGKPAEAVTYIKKATALNPYYTFQYPSTLGLADYNLGRYEEAISRLREALDHNESALNPRLFLAATYARLGRMEEATWQIAQITVNQPDVRLAKLGTILPFENRKYLDALLKDLRKAGLPE